MPFPETEVHKNGYKMYGGPFADHMCFKTAQTVALKHY